MLAFNIARSSASGFTEPKIERHDVALSRRSQGFNSPWGQYSAKSSQSPHNLYKRFTNLCHSSDIEGVESTPKSFPLEFPQALLPCSLSGRGLFYFAPTLIGWLHAGDTLGQGHHFGSVYRSLRRYIYRSWSPCLPGSDIVVSNTGKTFQSQLSLGGCLRKVGRYLRGRQPSPLHPINKVLSFLSFAAGDGGIFLFSLTPRGLLRVGLAGRGRFMGALHA